MKVVRAIRSGAGQGMPKQHVEVRKCCAVSADSVWQVAGDFCAVWHPLIVTMEKEHDARGNVIRRFTVLGEDIIYRERLTRFSASDLEFSYEHLEGIRAVKSYEANFKVI